MELTTATGKVSRAPAAALNANAESGAARRPETMRPRESGSVTRTSHCPEVVRIEHVVEDHQRRPRHVDQFVDGSST